MRWLVVVAVVALAVPAAASAKLKVYGGTTTGGAQIALDVVVNKKGKIKRITEMRALGLPSICDLSGQLTTYSAFPGPVKVAAKRFDVTYVQPTYGNESFVNGRFTGKRNLSGTLSFSYHFLADAQFPEENCNTGELAYTATRNGPDVVLPTARPRR